MKDTDTFAMAVLTIVALAIGIATIACGISCIYELYLAITTPSIHHLLYSGVSLLGGLIFTSPIIVLLTTY